MTSLHNSSTAVGLTSQLPCEAPCILDQGCIQSSELLLMRLLNHCHQTGLNQATCICCSASNTRPVTCMNTWSAVGKVNGRGYECQQKTLLVTLMGRAERFEAHSNHVFADFNWLRLPVAQCQDLAIFMVVMTNKTNYFTPCACV